MNEIDRIVAVNKDTFIQNTEHLLAGAAVHQHVAIDRLEFGGVEEDNLISTQRRRADIMFGAEFMTTDIPAALANASEPFPGEAEELYGHIVHYGNSVDYTDFVTDDETDEDDDQPRLF